jgi:hypothetical protein
LSFPSVPERTAGERWEAEHGCRLYRKEQMADLIEWSPPADKGNFIVDFIAWFTRVWVMGIVLMGGGCFAIYVVGWIFLRLIGAVHGPLFG